MIFTITKIYKIVYKLIFNLTTKVLVTNILDSKLIFKKLIEILLFLKKNSCYASICNLTFQLC